MKTQIPLLLVDNTADFRALVAEELRSFGFEVHEAANGLEALCMLTNSSSRWLAVLLDYEIPVMSGEKLIKEIRRLYPHLPLIVISDHLQELSENEEFWAFAPIEILSKPFQHTELICRLAAIEASHQL